MQEKSLTLMTNPSLSLSTLITLPASLADALEQIDTGVMVVNADHRITYVNAAICDTLALPREVLVGQGLWEMFPDAIGTVFQQQYAAVLHAPAPVEFDAPYARLGLWLHIRAVPSTDGLAIYLTDITKEKTEERRRQTSDATLRAFIDASPDAAILLDLDGTVLEVNQLALDRMGTKRESFIGADAYAALPPALAAARRQRNNEVIHSGEQAYFIDQRGEETCENTVVPVRDAQGIVTRLAIFSRDITERKRIETALHDQSQRLHSLVDNTPMAVIEWNADFVVTRWTGEAEMIFGWRAADTIGTAIADLHLIYEPDIPLMQKTMERLTDGVSQKVVSEHRNLARDGRIIHCTWYNSVLYDEHGLMSSVLSLVLDNTARLATEKALRESEERYSTLMYHVPTPIQGYLTDGTVIFWNRASEQVYGYTASEAIGCHLGDLIIPPELQPLFAQGLVLGAQLTQSGEFLPAGEVELLRKDGARVLVHSTHTAVCPPEGPTILFCLDLDLSERCEIDRAKDEFLTVLSHELQTPLTSMLGFTELALAKDTLEMYRRSVPIIQRNAKRQSRLVNELLDMSKLLQRRPDCQPVSTDFAQLAMMMVEKMIPGAEMAGLTLLMQPAHEKLSVQVDTKRMLICIEHLIGNSIKFTPAGGRITVTCGRQDACALLTVADTGRGIDADQLSLLFKPFQQVDRDEAAGGLGLGLAIVRGYVEWHGGTVRADSPGRGQGSTFTISLLLADGG